TTGDQSAYNADKLTIPPYWLDTPELRAELVKYYAEVSNFDSLVGMIRGELEARKLWDNTLFIVCSEQGTQLPFAKWTCYDNGLHTGIVVHWSGVTKPGTVIKELVATADIAPTFLEAAGGNAEDGDFDGKSFLKTLQGEQQVLHDYVYGAFTNCNIIDNRERIYPIRVIRDKSFSLLYNPNHESVTSNVTLTAALNMIKGSKDSSGTGASWVKLSRADPSAKALVQKLHHRPEFELYNRANDPYELKNEIDNPEYRVVAERLQKSLQRQLKRLGDANPIETEKKIIARKGVKKPKPKKGRPKK
ncbi:MAG: N-sulfoglucosamine sulfohydrolase, partial [Rhodothermales bacterium]